MSLAEQVIKKYKQPSQPTQRVAPVSGGSLADKVINRYRIRPDIKQSPNYLNAVANAEKMKQEAQKASSFSGMAGNTLRGIGSTALNFGKEIVRMPLTVPLKVTQTLTEAITKKPQVYTPQTGIEKFLYGDQPRQSYTQDQASIQKWGQAKGMGKLSSNLLGAGGATAEILMDLLPAGFGGKALKAIKGSRIVAPKLKLGTPTLGTSKIPQTVSRPSYPKAIDQVVSKSSYAKNLPPKGKNVNPLIQEARKVDWRDVEEMKIPKNTWNIEKQNSFFKVYNNIKRPDLVIRMERPSLNKPWRVSLRKIDSDGIHQNIASGQGNDFFKSITSFIETGKKDSRFNFDNELFTKSQPLQEGVRLKGKERGFIPGHPQASKILQSETGTGPKQGLNRFYPNILRSGERSLENQGTTGEELLKVMENQRVAGDLQAGKWKALVNQFIGQLNDAQKSNLTDVLEGKATPMDATVGTSAKVMRNLLNKVQSEAVGAGLNTGKLENYFPRKYNWSDMVKKGRKEKIYQHMVDTGQASTKAEAEQFFKDFIIKNTERKAGNLEYERMFDIPGYERDPEKALTMYAETAAKRISEAKAFGKGDENISALINKISDEGGDYRSAQKIFDYVYKGEDKNAFTNALLGYNAFTKLSLAFFSNITQSANTAAKGGLLNTIKGAAQALVQGIKATKGKRYDDIATLANAFDEHITLQETGLSNKFMKGAMYLFQKVENFNRRTAANTGVLFAKELAQNPKSAYAVRQLKSLGLDISEIAKGKLTQEQLLTAANKMAKITQFKANALMMPQAWRTPLGKVLTQFKGFSFMQTKFLRDEVIKEAGKGNLAPLLRFLVIAPVASYITQSTRNWINQAKTQADFRKLDLYRKAAGDLPSDFISQMQYANSKKDKWYTTPLTNVKNFASPVIGPTGGDIMQLMSALEQKGNIARQNEQWYSKHPLAQSDPNLDLKRFAVQKIPFVGRNLSNTVFGYKPTVAKQAKDEAIKAIENNDTEAFKKALQKDPYLNDKEVIQRLISDITAELQNKTVKRKELNRKYNPFYTN